MKRFSLPKEKRLITNRQFKAVLNHRLCSSNGLLTVYMAENDLAGPRVGVSVGKSCGGAVVRNRLKRLLREAFRQSQEEIPAGFDYLLMISPQWPKKLDESIDSKKAVKQLKLEQVRISFLSLVSRLVEKMG